MPHILVNTKSAALQQSSEVRALTSAMENVKPKKILQLAGKTEEQLDADLWKVAYL